ncbi:MAG: indole-3-glycerol phosphate synthase TrpC [Lachnospiraceae bacterium]|nr:indole-3-glycerol phosphate synthase TrpC [Lachnospiraceae bacterium]
MTEPNILTQIADHTHLRIQQKYAKDSERWEIMGTARQAPARASFFDALKSPGMSFICEVKKASPSKGIIAKDFPYLEIAKEYENIGAAAVSVLTEPKWFLGKDEYLEEITAGIAIPALRKDFTVDPIMIYEAKCLGASAVLLICSLLDDKTLAGYMDIAHSLQMDALVETHDEEEVERAVRLGANIIGVNNRNLKDFTVDFENTLRLREMIPPDRICVSESGVKSTEDIRKLKNAGVDAVLIGEALMRAEDKKAMITQLNS